MRSRVGGGSDGEEGKNGGGKKNDGTGTRTLAHQLGAVSKATTLPTRTSLLIVVRWSDLLSVSDVPPSVGQI